MAHLRNDTKSTKKGEIDLRSAKKLFKGSNSGSHIVSSESLSGAAHQLQLSAPRDGKEREGNFQRKSNCLGMFLPFKARDPNQ